jgi:hypothetical protein
VRALQVQTHTSGDTINVCHSSCVSATRRRACREGRLTTQTLKDGGTLQDYLSKVAAWMNKNPNDGGSMLG